MEILKLDARHGFQQFCSSWKRWIWRLYGAVLEVGFVAILCLRFSYPLQCVCALFDLIHSCCSASFWISFRCRAVHFMWKEGSSGASGVTILLDLLILFALVQWVIVYCNRSEDSMIIFMGQNVYRYLTTIRCNAVRKC